MTPTAFGRLVDDLAVAGYPTWFLYDPRADPWRLSLERGFPGRMGEPFCRGAWNIVEGTACWRVYRGWRDEREEHRFASEQDACSWLHAQVMAEHAPGVRAMTFDELPGALKVLLVHAGAVPEASRLGERLVAREHGGMALRLVADATGFTLEHPSIAPPTVGERLFRSADLEDTLRVLVQHVGSRLEVTPGEPRWGIGRLPLGADDHRAALARWSDVTLERIVAAYLGAPEGLLDQISAPAAVDLLDEEIRERALERRWTLLPSDGPHGVRFTAGGDVDLALCRDGEQFVLRFRRERTNDDIELGRFDELADARSAMLRELG